MLFCFQEMSCEWIKQEPLEEDEMQFEAGPKQEIPLDVEETQSVKVEDGETYHKNEEDYALESDSQLKVLLFNQFIAQPHVLHDADMKQKSKNQ